MSSSLVDHRIAVLEDAVEELHLVHHTKGAALLRGAVVGEDHEDGVVEFAHGTQTFDQPTDLVIGVIEERGERFLEPGADLLLILGQVVPGVDAGVAGREFGPFGDHPEFELPFVPTLTDDVPALVVLAAVLLQVALGCLVRGVGRTERHVGEERAIGTHTLAVADHLHQLVDHVFADVIAVFGATRRFDRVVVSTPIRGGTGRSHLRGSRRTGRSRERAATGRTDLPPSTAPWARGAICRRSRWSTPRSATPRRPLPRGC